MVSWEKLKNKRTSSNSSERVHMHPISNYYTREREREKLHNFRTQRISSSLNRLCQCDLRFLWVVGFSIITSQQLDKKQVKISTIHTKHFFFIRDENSYSDGLTKRRTTATKMYPSRVNLPIKRHDSSDP